MIVRRGPWRGRRGWIAGDLLDLNPYATRAIVFSGRGARPLNIADLDRADRQLELPLQAAKTKTPPACVHPR